MTANMTGNLCFIVHNLSYCQYSNKSSEDAVTFLRAIIKALENYTNSSLAGLEFKALGLENYFYILKEVISYFK
jgi:hypothetical protein